MNNFYGFNDKLQALQQMGPMEKIFRLQKGVEKESLRVQMDGRLSLKDHPASLGSPLTHPLMTTDYAEALLEFMTAPFWQAEDMLAQLKQLHQFALRKMDPQEYFWVSSMPCLLESAGQIRLARFGTSWSGRMKHIYRHGLSFRYGSLMQCIAGIHYNFSFSTDFWQGLRSLVQTELSPQVDFHDFVSQQYFAIQRNLYRYAWLLVYLFGASPAACKSFLSNRQNNLLSLSDCTSYLPYATSLRMGKLGYQSDAQENLLISLNSLPEYLQQLDVATQTPYAPYRQIGLKNPVVPEGEGGEDGKEVGKAGDEEYRQLNTNILQMENEYYALVRPKRISSSGLRPVFTLKNEGVQYLELRLFDLNPFAEVGITLEQMDFLEIFLFFCALEDSPLFSDKELKQHKENLHLSVTEGRRPGLQLQRGDESVTLQEWGNTLCQALEPIARLLDQLPQKNGQDSQRFTRALQQQWDKCRDSSRTPSAMVLAEMHERNEEYVHFVRRHSLALKEKFLQEELSSAFISDMERKTLHSWQKQHEIERADRESRQSFEDYLQNFYQGKKRS